MTLKVFSYLIQCFVNNPTIYNVNFPSTCKNQYSEGKLRRKFSASSTDMELSNHSSLNRANGHLPPLRLTSTARRHRRAEETSKEARSFTCQSKGIPLTLGKRKGSSSQREWGSKKNREEERDEAEEPFAWMLSSAATPVSSAQFHSSCFSLESLFISFMGLKTGFDTVLQTGSFK